MLSGGATFSLIHNPSQTASGLQKRPVEPHTMEETLPFHFTKLDILFSLLGFVMFLVDVALDIWAVVSLYQEGSYISMGLLIFLLLGSSVLLQIFSWIWYSDPSVTLETSVEKFAQRHGLLGLLHVFQLGVFLRCAGLLELTIRNHKWTDRVKEDVTGAALHDLNMLRLMEAFSESAPQLVLMVHTLILHEQDLQFVAVAKIAACFAAIAVTMTFYHRSMRQFVSEATRMGWLSSLVYFLWNLLLITARVVSVALFASALPCYIAIHFVCLWTLLILWVWWQGTDFMYTKGGEWLYRATVGLIWYFIWFKVASGRTVLKSNVYHLCMWLDTVLLVFLWWGTQVMESARLSPLLISPYVLLVAVPGLYIAGVALRLVYYRKCHPKQPCVEIRRVMSPTYTHEGTGAMHDHTEDDSRKSGEPVIFRMALLDSVEAQSDSLEADTVVTPEAEASLKPQNLVAVHKRMRNMAVHFYL